MAKKKQIENRRVLLQGGNVITMDALRSVGTGDVLIEGDRIAAVGSRPMASSKVDEVIDCKGRIVIPGLVQAHTHLCQTLFRGRADDLELLDWLEQRIWPFEAAHTKESLYVSALLGGAELLRSGTTSILDMGTVHHTDSIFKAAKKLGLRAAIGKAMMDTGKNVPPHLRESTEASLKESIKLADRWHGQENGRLRYAFAPRFVLSCTDALLKGVVEAARARGLLIHTHASENQGEIEVVRERCGKDNVSHLASLGMVGKDTVLAHCVWVTSGEQRILADSGTHVAHCPSSNLKLASGIAKVPELLRLGINVALGADGAPCNNNLDCFTEMRLAGLIHKPRFGPTAMPAPLVFELATRGGAKALGLEREIGSLEVGKKADVVVVDPRVLHAAPTADPYSTLVYALSGRDVEHVFVDGIQRVKKGRVLGLGLAKLLKDADAWALKLSTSVM